MLKRDIEFLFASLKTFTILKTVLKSSSVCLDRQPSHSINIVGKDDNSVSAPEKAGNKRLRDFAGFGLGST